MDNRICGVHAVYEALASHRLPIERIHIAREAHSPKLKEILDLARDRGVPIRKEGRAVLDRLAEGGLHQGIIAISGALPYSDFDALFKGEMRIFVLLDCVDAAYNLVGVGAYADGGGEE